MTEMDYYSALDITPEKVLGSIEQEPAEPAESEDTKGSKDQELAAPEQDQDKQANNDADEQTQQAGSKTRLLMTTMRILLRLLSRPRKKTPNIRPRASGQRPRCSGSSKRLPRPSPRSAHG